jgi:hypothetical protein
MNKLKKTLLVLMGSLLFLMLHFRAFDLTGTLTPSEPHGIYAAISPTASLQLEPKRGQVEEIWITLCSLLRLSPSLELSFWG